MIINLRRLFCAFVALDPGCLSNTDLSLSHYERKRGTIKKPKLLDYINAQYEVKTNLHWLVFEIIPPGALKRFHQQHQMGSDPKSIQENC